MAFGRRFKRFAKKAKRKVKRAMKKNKFLRVVVKAHTVPLKKLHKVNQKIEGTLQNAVKSVLPFTKPFIDFHNKVSRPVTGKGFAALGIAPKEKTRITAILQNAAASIPGQVGKLATVATLASPIAASALRTGAGLTKSAASLKTSAAKAAKQLAALAKRGNASAAKGLALAAAASQVARGLPAQQVRKTLAAGGALKRKVAKASAPTKGTFTVIFPGGKTTRKVTV